MNFDLYICAVYTGKNWQKKQQRCFDSVESAIEFGGKCTKKYPAFCAFKICGVNISENDLVDIAYYDRGGWAKCLNPATSQMLELALAN